VLFVLPVSLGHHQAGLALFARSAVGGSSIKLLDHFRLKAKSRIDKVNKNMAPVRMFSGKSRPEETRRGLSARELAAMLKS
jgi:hypothetical protein